jgi:hypothetical protein
MAGGRPKKAAGKANLNPLEIQSTIENDINETQEGSLELKPNHNTPKIIDQDKEIIEEENSYLDKAANSQEEYEKTRTIILQNDKLKAENELIELKRQILDQNRDERKRYAKNIFCLTTGWTIAIFTLLFLIGLGYIKNVSDKVLITLITSTTINFFGFFFLVIKYLFNAGVDEIKSDKVPKRPKKRNDSF